MHNKSTEVRLRILFVVLLTISEYSFAQSRSVMPFSSADYVTQAWARGDEEKFDFDPDHDDHKNWILTALTIVFDARSMKVPNVNPQVMSNIMGRLKPGAHFKYDVEFETKVSGKNAVIRCEVDISRITTEVQGCRLMREGRESEIHFMTKPEMKLPSADLVKLKFSNLKLQKIYERIEPWLTKKFQ